MSYLDEIKFNKKIVFEKIIPPEKATYKQIKFKNKKLEKYLKEKNIKLYSHQAQAIEHVKNGKNVVITTPTASGKSYIYIFSVLEKLAENPYATSIVIFPLKALARDQYAKIKELIDETEIQATVEIYDGDTPKEKRRQIKQNPPNFL
ncbi:DEAD/DEAH box helicase, partial [Hydrogenivirga sp. 128-5-R1-1]|uniref:DEAD/DEAH box helicase n=1 Tax=Hydrogenivirga sp. 128-5-R1-1 TaxID=392423 RepID=UPI00015F1AD2